MSIKFFSSKKRIIITVIVLLIVAAIAWFIFGPKNVPADKQYKVHRTTLEDTISFAGEIDASEKASMQFQTSGKLVWVGPKVGQYVQAGDKIAQLDQRQLQRQMQKYLNTFGKVRNDFDQSKDDYGDEYQYQPNDESNEMRRLFEKAQLDLNNSVLDVELQQASLEYASLYTPVSGIITRMDAESAGVNITPVTTFEVINPATIYFSADIDQTDLNSINESQTGEITLDAFPDNKIAGTVNSISFTPKEGETGTVYKAKILILNPGSIQYRLGMTGDVSFVLGKRDNVLVIPLRFLQSEGDKYYVTKKEGNGSKKTEIEIGEEFNGEIEVTKGLSENDIIYEAQ
jgi:RND family efflux transporter MFP subunit